VLCFIAHFKWRKYLSNKAGFVLPNKNKHYLRRVVGCRKIKFQIKSNEGGGGLDI